MRGSASSASPAFSVTMLLVWAVAAMAVLGGLVWLALAYSHSGLSLFFCQCYLFFSHSLSSSAERRWRNGEKI